MTAYAPDFTARLKVAYRANGKNHKVQFRAADAATAGGIAFTGLVTDFFITLTSFMPTDWVVLGASVAEVGSSVFLPLAIPPVAPTATGTLGGLADSPQFLTAVGLTSAGSSARLYLIGAAVSADSSGNYSDYRVTPSEVVSVGAIISALNDLVTGGMVGNDGNPITWYSYLNVGYNAYWQRKARS